MSRIRVGLNVVLTVANEGRTVDVFMRSTVLDNSMLEVTLVDAFMVSVIVSIDELKFLVVVAVG